jgi:cobaltochelatase CobN
MTRISLALWILVSSLVAGSAMAQPTPEAPSRPASTEQAGAPVDWQPSAQAGPEVRWGGGGPPAPPAAAYTPKPMLGDRPSVLIISRDPGDPGKAALLRKLAREADIDLTFEFVDQRDTAWIAGQAEQKDIVLLDRVMPGAFAQLLSQAREALANYRGRVATGLTDQTSATAGLSPVHAETIARYYENGGEENFRRLLAYLRAEVMGMADTAPPDPPIVLPEQAIWHPDAAAVFATLEDYLAWRSPEAHQPVIGVGFHRSSLSDVAMDAVEALVRRLEATGAFVVPFYDPNDADQVDPLVMKDGKTFADAFVTFTGMYANVDRQRRWLEKLDRRMVQALPYGTSYEDEWREDPEGFPLFRTAVFYHLSEQAGRVDATVVSARRRGDDRLVGIPEQIDALAERLIRYAALRRKPNADKTVAIFVWNSPAGEQNFSASYLNIPASLENIFAALRREGYSVADIGETELIADLQLMIRPYYRMRDEAALRELLTRDLAEKVPVDEYKAWFDANIPEQTRRAQADAWEPPEESYLTIQEPDSAYFVVPRKRIGNVILLPQPLRGARRDAEADIFHDKTRPMHHAYRAVYQAVTGRMGADAIIHLGTHGTQEWALGKERGPSVFDDSQTTIGAIPVIYPYTVANVGEATIAKRRGRATIVSHNSPPFAPAGLYGELTEFHDLLHQWSDIADGGVKARVEAQLVDLAARMNLLEDIGLDRDAALAAPEEFLKQAHDYIHELAGMAQPLGLHTFGAVGDRDGILLTILQILGPDYVRIWEPEPEELYAQPFEDIQVSAPFLMLASAVEEGLDPGGAPEAARPLLEEARRHFRNFTSEEEIPGLITALGGGFVKPGSGNDPLRNPEAVPTGRNLYAFDPQRIPTKAAWEAGAQLADDLIEQYQDRHDGAFPDKFAFTLWSTETVLHFGVVEAQILRLMGLEPAWNARGEVVDVAVTPRTELGRPRADVVVTLTGLYRDNLPELTHLIGKAVALAYDQDEPDNAVRHNAQATEQLLIQRGIAAANAASFARLRMFGPESGTYGTDVPGAIEDSGTWEKESQVAELYLRRMGFAYDGTSGGAHSLRLPDVDLLGENLKGVKAAVLSRSTNNQGLVSLDHTYEYLGGLGLAVRHLTGDSPELFVTDLRDTRNFRNKTAADFIALELRTRDLHPRYVAELMEEGFNGATSMVSHTDNLFGWTVMEPKAVRPDQWAAWHDVYIADKHDLGLRDWFMETHPGALAQVAARMLEAVRKGYWEPSEEMKSSLIEAYRAATTDQDFQLYNPALEAFIDSGADVRLVVDARASEVQLPPAQAEADPIVEQADEPGSEPATERVSGMMLEEITSSAETPQNSSAWSVWAALVAMLAVFLAGMAVERRSLDRRWEQEGWEQQRQTSQ